MATLAGVATGEAAAAGMAPADTVSVGQGSYATTPVPGANPPPQPEELFTTSNVAAPLPTNTWYSGEHFGNSSKYGSSSADDGQYREYGGGFVMAQPAVVDTKAPDNPTGADGLIVYYSQGWSGEEEHQGAVHGDWSTAPGIDVSHSGTTQFADNRLDDYGDWHCRLKWGDGTGTTLTSTVVKGSPFVYNEFTGGGAEISFVNCANKWPNDGSEYGATVGTGSVEAWGYTDSSEGHYFGVTVTRDGFDGADEDLATDDQQVRHFGVFAPPGSTIDGIDSSGTITAKTLTSQLSGESGSGVLTVAPMPSASASLLDEFADYAYNIVRETAVDWTYGQSVDSSVETTYRFTTEQQVTNGTKPSGTLSWLYPHQHKYTAAGTSLTDWTMWSVRGQLKLHKGSQFTISQDYPGILPQMPTGPLGSSETDTLRSELRAVYEYPPDTSSTGDAPYVSNGVPSNTYFGPKDLWRNMICYQLAEQVENGATLTSAIVDWFVGAIEARLNNWFDATTTDFTFAGNSYSATDADGNPQEIFEYVPHLGTMLGAPMGFWARKGLTDHHFHYGYLVTVAAEVARWSIENGDGSWVADYGDMVELLARDYANWERPDRTSQPTGTTPRDAPKDAFPFLRNFDVYGGHSWAAGIDSGAAVNQESSSEAVNAYAALIKWGELTGNTGMRDAGVFLYTQELHAVWEYWFDADDDSLPEQWGEEYWKAEAAGTYRDPHEPAVTATGLSGDGYNDGLFYASSDPEQMYGIQWLPAGPQSFYLGHDRQHADRMWEHVVRVSNRGAYQNDPGEYGSDMVSGWGASAYTFRAMSDPEDAAQLLDADANIEAVDGGNSRAWAKYITDFTVAAGAPNQNVTADTTFFQVFDDGDSGERTYVAYNAASTSTTVTFSDGHSMSVPANSLASESHDNIPKPGAPGSVTVTEKDSYSITLSWTAPADEVFKYRIFVDGDYYGETYEPGTTVERLASGTTYDVRVETVADSGATSDRVQPARGTVTTDTGDTHVGTISNLRVAGRAGDRLVLAWDQPAEPGQGLAEYTIHYRAAGASSWQTTTVAAPGRTDAPATGEITGLSGDSDYEVAVTATDAAGNTAPMAPQPPLEVTTLPGTSSAQSPYFSNAITVPGRVEAEHWDRGGTATAFGDHDPNVHVGAVEEGVSFRDTTEGGADVTNVPDGLGVGYMDGDEYLEYTLEFVETGTYTLRLHCAAGGSTGGRIGPLHAELDGQAITAEQDFHDTGGWDSFRTIELGTFDVSATGQKTLRLYFSGIQQTVDWFELYTGERDSTPPTAPASASATKPTSTTADIAWDASTDDTALEGYAVYQARAAFDRSNWSASANMGSGAADALDGDGSTYWWSQAPIADNAITFTVDMGQVNTLSRLEWDHFQPVDVPATVDIAVSTDGSSWTTVKSGVSPSLETVVTFDSAVDAQYVRISETDSTNGDWWKIVDVRAYAWDPTASGATLSWEQVAEVTDGSTSTTVDGLTAGRDALFGVSAIDRLGNESPKTAATTGSLGGVDTTPPATPSGVTASTTDASLTVGWSAVSDAANYRIYVDGVHERTVAAGTTEVTLWGREPGRTYDVAVSAVDASGFESGRSNTATATVGTTIDFAQQAVDDDADTLIVKFTPKNEAGVAAVSLNYDVNGTAQSPVTMVDPGETGTWTARLDGLANGDQVTYSFTYEFAGASQTTANYSATFSGDGIGTVSGSNASPTVSISGPTSASTGESVTLTASAADSDGSVASYDWSTSDGQTGSGSSFTTSWSSTGDYTVSVTVTDDGGATATTSQTISVTSGSSGAVAAINAGGTAVTVDGVDYAASGTNVSGGTVSSTGDAISGGSDALYGTERYGDFTYDIPVSSGTYDVTVHLAEIYFTSTGSRVFDITVEGTTVVNDLDLVSAVGHDTAYTATATVTPSDGSITVTGTASADLPKISAVTVRSSSGDTTAPAAPTNLAASNVTSSSVDLSWDASTSADVATYAIYDSSGSQVASGISATSATVTGLSANTQYTFTVRAVDDAGNESGDSTAVSVTTRSDTDTTAPAAPTNLTAPSKTSTSVDLSWDASTSADVASYAVYDTTAGSAVASGITGTSTTVTGLSADTQYSYAVTATDDAGNESGQSATLTVTTAPASQSAYNGPHSLPGRVQAQDFDTGGEETAYHDTTSGNAGGAYRTTDVDIEATGDSSGRYNVGWTASGEWLEYTVDVSASGTYALSARVATLNDGITLSVSVNGTEQISGASVPNTGSWQTWQTVDLGTVDLSAGKPTIRIASSGGVNLNWFEFADTATLETALNCGGGAFTAGDGTAFEADANYTNGASASTSDAISGTTDDTLYQSNRWGTGVTYEIPVSDASGTYDVVLHFAEDYWTSSGSRVFDVVVEGTEAVSNLDIYAEVGHDAALTRTVSGITASDGSITIEFPADTDNALVSGIEVIRQ